MEEEEIESISRILRNLGAEDEAARVMARQLLKRAGQLAEERSVSRVEALNYLLQVTIAGKEGTVYEGPPLGNGTTMRDQGEKKG
jgi:hypothetical protein